MASSRRKLPSTASTKPRLTPAGRRALDALRSGASLQFRYSARPGSGRCFLVVDDVPQPLPEPVFRNLRETESIAQLELQPGVSIWTAAGEPRNGLKVTPSMITYDELRTLVRNHKDSKLNQLSGIVGRADLPFNGRRDRMLLTELATEALARYAVNNGGSIPYDNYSFGVTTVSSRGSVRSTDPAAFGLLIERLVDDELSTFYQDALERWKQLQIASGRYRPSGKVTQAEKFSQQRFRGFD